MDVLFWIIGIHLFIYAVILIFSYLMLKSEQKSGERTKVTIRHILNYWPGVSFIPFFGPICLLTMVTVLGFEKLKDWIITTKFWDWIQNILNKEI